MTDYFRMTITKKRQILLMMNTARIYPMMVQTFERFDVFFVNEIFSLVLCPDLAAERPEEYESLNNIIVIDNLPKVDQVKLEKLKGAITKVYSKFGVYRNEYYPVDEQGNTKG